MNNIRLGCDGRSVAFASSTHHKSRSYLFITKTFWLSSQEVSHTLKLFSALFACSNNLKKQLKSVWCEMTVGISCQRLFWKKLTFFSKDENFSNAKYLLKIFITRFMTYLYPPTYINWKGHTFKLFLSFVACLNKQIILYFSVIIHYSLFIIH